jgi:hypothetical protein
MSEYERGTEHSGSAPLSGSTRIEERSVARPTEGRIEERRAPAMASMTESPMMGIEPIRRDRVRWGPIWAGVLVAIGTFLLLQLALVATGAVEVVEPGTGDAVLSAIAAGIAFLLGGVVTGATSMWKGLDDGLLHGVVLWAISLVVLFAFAGFGSGLALGAFDFTDTLEDVVLVTEPDPAATGTEVTADDAQEAAGWGLLALVVALVATSVGAVAGAKLWPPEPEIDLRDSPRATDDPRVAETRETSTRR